MTRLLHISDIHFGPPHLPKVREALLRLIPDLDVDGIVVSGDFTQRAKEKEFIEARQFLDQMRSLVDVPQVVIPGNHDVPLYRVWERMTNPLGLYRKYISPDLDSKLALGNLTLIGLDSTSPHRRISDGQLEVSQLDFTRQALADAPHGNWKIIVAHHHFAPAHDRWKDRVMTKAGRAIDCFVDLDVDLILGGHLHRAYVGNSLDFFTGKHRERGIIIVQSGTTTSRRGRGREKEKNTLNVIEFESTKVQVKHYLYFSAVDQFAATSRHLFPKPGLRLDEEV
jgi:3',5'-cyclic AMP phosphodiesterase CpdA